MFEKNDIMPVMFLFLKIFSFRNTSWSIKKNKIFFLPSFQGSPANLSICYRDSISYIYIYLVYSFLLRRIVPLAGVSMLKTSLLIIELTCRMDNAI